MDDFVYFSEDPAVEALFEHLLRERNKVEFMGLVEWFLGVHFLVNNKIYSGRSHESVRIGC